MNHHWNHDTEQRLSAEQYEDGKARNVKICTECGIFKITIFSSNYASNEYRSSREGRTLVVEPPCVRRIPGEVVGL